MADLAERILKVVDHLDRLAEAAIQDGYSLSVVGERGENYFSTCSPEDTRRHCAADREIVEYLRPLVGRYPVYECLLEMVARGYGIQP